MFFGSGGVLGLIDLLTNKEDGGIGVFDLDSQVSGGEEGGLVQVGPGMFSGSSSIFIGGPGEKGGLESMII